MSLSKNPKLIAIAKIICRDLRKHAKNSEKVFWENVRNRKILNYKFYRQYPLFFDYFGKETFYIADFYCFEKKLVIEIDGGYHKRQEKYDELRTEIINMLGLKVVRFNNEEIGCNINHVLTKLKYELTNNSPPK